MSTSMTAQLIADALLMMAMWRRGKPDALMHTRPMESFGQLASTEPASIYVTRASFATAADCERLVD